MFLALEIESSQTDALSLYQNSRNTVPCEFMLMSHTLLACVE